MNRPKAILIICDGPGDRPIPEFGRQTPLEHAHTPNLDRLAKAGVSGVMSPIDIGICPGSDTAHLAILGYDPVRHYTGRGPFEAAGIQMAVRPQDICFRVNMGTVGRSGKIIDRRAGRIDDTSEFARLFNKKKIKDVTFFVKKGTGHRLGLVMRGPGLSSNIKDVDPHIIGALIQKVQPRESTKAARKTARILQTFLDEAHRVLKTLPSNKAREKRGLLPANYFLVRGAGTYPDLPSFHDKYGLRAACVAGAGLYKGIGRVLGMAVIEVPGATGKPDSDLRAKIDAVKKLYNKYDFFFVHFKGADTLGEDGDAQGKQRFIEKIDSALAPLFSLKQTIIVVTADHSTPCHLKAHSADDVPIVIHGEHVRDDDVESFGERACAKGRLGHIRGLNVMPILTDLMGLAKMFGA